jgi:hypothetical protein
VSTNRNWIQGAASHDERARIREVVATKGGWRRSSGSAAKATTLTWGDLASGLKGPRIAMCGAEREVSRGRSSESKPGRVTPEPRKLRRTKGRTERRAERP